MNNNNISFVSHIKSKFNKLGEIIKIKMAYAMFECVFDCCRLSFCFFFSFCALCHSCSLVELVVAFDAYKRR